MELCPGDACYFDKNQCKIFYILNSILDNTKVILPQLTVSCYLPKMPQVAKWVNSDLLKGFTVPQVAQKHGWPEPLVWSQALVNTDDFNRFKALQWGIQT